MKVRVRSQRAIPRAIQDSASRFCHFCLLEFLVVAKAPRDRNVPPRRKEISAAESERVQLRFNNRRKRTCLGKR